MTDTKRTKVAKITGTKMEQTATAVVLEWKRHRIIGKRFRKARKYLVHNPNNQFKTGESVIIAETRPLSRHKHWIIVGHASPKEVQS
jgi:small subunit ribosomal protein S17